MLFLHFSMASTDVTILVCGGGHGAHVLAGLASTRPQTHVRVLTLYQDRAERWNKAKNAGFTVCISEAGDKITQVKAKSFLVTKDPRLAIFGCDVIIIVVPAYAHEGFFVALKPYIKPGMTLVGLPGRCGFELQVRDILGELFHQINVLNFESLPWTCRISEYGKKVTVLGTKRELMGCIHGGKEAGSILHRLQNIIGDQPVLKMTSHPLAITLMSINAILHPTIMYTTWRQWDGISVRDPPLFYQGVDDVTADLLSDVSQEVVNLAREIQRHRPDIDLNHVTPLYDWYMRVHTEYITDKLNLKSVLRTNTKYAGLEHPMERTSEGRYVPNFNYRYLVEDIPYGLVVIRGIAEIMEVSTPNIDRIINWAQVIIDNEFLHDCCLKGKDLITTRAPQRYHIHTLNDLIRL